MSVKKKVSPDGDLRYKKVQTRLTDESSSFMPSDSTPNGAKMDGEEGGHGVGGEGDWEWMSLCLR